VSRAGVVRWRARAPAADRAAGGAAGGPAMRRSVLFAGVALALTSTLAFAAPESLLPDVFDNPAPTPSPAPRPAPAPGSDAAPPQPGSVPVIQPLPGRAAEAPSAAPLVELPSNFPTL